MTFFFKILFLFYSSPNSDNNLSLFHLDLSLSLSLSPTLFYFLIILSVCFLPFLLLSQEHVLVFDGKQISSFFVYSCTDYFQTFFLQRRKDQETVICQYCFVCPQSMPNKACPTKNKGQDRFAKDCLTLWALTPFPQV